MNKRTEQDEAMTIKDALIFALTFGACFGFTLGLLVAAWMHYLLNSGG